ncbi:phosphate-starvation-inducible protein PsiE [Halothiobacillus neapolitanus]|jgi:phosphate starvation-inducible membrane PsiE|uniref:Protein PsiE n=1 Tax=Halothiobacillus neapolitanus (strain ATCC 23641 / DSM 15147 / CIP 104769 / NCIMB 8539 / c2) TaxID=555778 RepID=D0KZ70_HALNC|nr:phosphate-starvation-inducible PsiE family protein [Halothiobacillus neapolitanus]ACX95743.1 phosphate-starvation-inducible E [Halothiobacillus neapolitanus c2]TDN66049.1 phosphate starvation-inducible membrane PsiE [Halothiobacillus neapolitanus]
MSGLSSSHKFIERVGNELNNIAHVLLLFVLWVAVLWSTTASVVDILHKGTPSLDDLLLFFIYLEILAMIGIYFQTKRMPVRFLIYIAITAITRVLVVDIKVMSNITIITYTGAIALLAIAILVIKYSSARFPGGSPDQS